MASNQAPILRQRRTRSSQPIFISNFVPPKSSPVRRTPARQSSAQDLSKLNLSREEMKEVISKMADERGELLRTIRHLGGRSPAGHQETSKACQTNDNSPMNKLLDSKSQEIGGDGYVPQLESETARLEEATALVIGKMEALTSAVERHCNSNKCVAAMGRRQRSLHVKSCSIGRERTVESLINKCFIIQSSIKN